MDQSAEGVFVRPNFLIPASELHFTFVRSSGPGGQNVNKNATKVRLKWWIHQSSALKAALSAEEEARVFKKAEKHLTEDGSIQTVSDRFRTREANRKACGEKLGTLLRNWLKKPKPRVRTKPSRASVQRRLTQKKQRSQVKKSRQKPADDE